MMIVCILANSADPDEMPQYAAFHLGIHCLAKNMNEKVYYHALFSI